MIKYFVYGCEVTRGKALAHWRQSETYRNAKFAESIFSNWEAGNRDQVLLNHLREAGIDIQGFRDAEAAPEDDHG